ncbi:TetR/AcrR family transcriptional regulator [Cryptosporangium sp. NPDC051539]|uniref:TetR/AcrR family transcriptional regulator n=1 Tax=Cryptosporangium sp. NPDC051539 TaxID=3363962 RepID=UPI0037900CD1
MNDERTRTRRRIVAIAAELLEQNGLQSVSTRSVAAAAGVRAASLYGLFGDMDGLLDAVAVQAFDLYLAEKQELAPTDDPVDDVRRGWDMHVDFGLRHPALYVLMFGTGRPGRRPPAANRAHHQLVSFFDRVAAAGRLRVPSATAASLSVAAGTGITLALIAAPAEERDLELSVKMRESVVASVIIDALPGTDPGLASLAVALDASLGAAVGEDLPLRPTETALMRDWLHQLAR